MHCRLDMPASRLSCVEQDISLPSYKTQLQLSITGKRQSHSEELLVLGILEKSIDLCRMPMARTLWLLSILSHLKVCCTWQ